MVREIAEGVHGDNPERIFVGSPEKITKGNVKRLKKKKSYLKINREDFLDKNPYKNSEEVLKKL